MKKIVTSGVVLTLGTICGDLAAAEPDVRLEANVLRQEIAVLRAAYEARLQSLERRLRTAEGAAAEPGTRETAMSSVLAERAATAIASSGGGASALNPAISLILSGTYTRTSQGPESFSIGGFQLPADAEVGPGTRGFSLAESELGFAANIDTWMRGVAAIALHPDDEVSVEEAYVRTTSLGHGLSLTAGRFFSGIGYLSSQHAHNWDFVDTRSPTRRCSARRSARTGCASRGSHRPWSNWASRSDAAAASPAATTRATAQA